MFRPMQLLIALLLVVGCRDRVSVQPAEAQQYTGTQLRVWTTDGGLLSGSGTVASPLEAEIHVDSTLTGTGSAGAPLTAIAALGTVDFAIFGDGSDGTHTFDGSAVILGMTPSANTYTLTRDIFCSGCTIDSGVSITGPYRVFDNGTLVLNGKIHRNGATGGTPTACATVSAGTLAGQLAGGVGGSTAGGAAGNGNAATVPFGCSTSVGGLCRGASGGAGASGAGATAGVTTIGAATLGTPRIFRLGMEGLNRSSVVWATASSGAGGRGDAANARAGGAGGCTGGYVVVSARTITGTGSVESVGGAGGSGQAGGNTGGGGGAAGGWIFIVIGSGSYPTTVNTGGAGGAAQGTGVAGGTGGDGIVVKYKLGVQ